MVREPRKTKIIGSIKREAIVEARVTAFILVWVALSMPKRSQTAQPATTYAVQYDGINSVPQQYAEPTNTARHDCATGFSGNTGHM